MKIVKSILKFVFGFIGIVYLGFAIFSIICLLKKNEFGYPQFGNKTVVIIEEDGNYFKKGDLVVLEKPKNEDVNTNDAVFFIDDDFSKNTLNIGSIIGKDVINANETTYHVNGYDFSSSHLIGKVVDSVKYATIGTIIGLMTSKWGFFVMIIIPFFILFIIELFGIYVEIKYGKKKNK